MDRFDITIFWVFNFAVLTLLTKPTRIQKQKSAMKLTLYRIPCRSSVFLFINLHSHAILTKD